MADLDTKALRELAEKRLLPAGGFTQQERMEMHDEWLQAADAQTVLSLLNRLTALEAERDRLEVLVREANTAINAAYQQADAEWRDHQTTEKKCDEIVRAWRTKARAALQGGQADA